MRVQKDKIQSGQKRDKRFEGEGGVGVLHLQRGTGEPGSTVEVYKLEESGEEVTVLVEVRPPEEAGSQQGGQLQA